MTTALLDAPVTIKTFGNKEIELMPELKKLAEGEEANQEQGCFRILTEETGDERVVWGRSIPEINAAKETFNDLVAQGMVPYRVDPSTGQSSGRVMDEFDPTAKEVIFLPMRAVAAG